MEKQNEHVLVCMPTALLDIPAGAAMREKCASCGAEVWVSPAGLIQAGANAKIMCIPCSQPMLQDKKNKLMAPSEAVLKVVRKHAGCTNEEALKIVRKITGRDFDGD